MKNKIIGENSWGRYDNEYGDHELVQELVQGSRRCV